VAGLVVLRVGQKTAAERAGVEVGDTIAAVNGEKVTTVAAFKKLIERALTDGKPVDLAISRSGQDIAVSVRIPEASAGQSP
jgi:S1-C subfamily serine protease